MPITDSPLHSKQQTEHGIHTPIAFIYADEVERIAAGGFEDNDLNKVAKQEDNDTFWCLDTVSPPTWIPFGGGGVSTDELVKTTAADDTANYLGSKFQDSPGIEWTISANPNQQMIANIIPDSTTQQIEVAKGGSLIGTRKQINLIEGSNVTLTVADNPGNNAVDITVASTGGGGGTDQYVKVSAADTTSAYLDSKITVSLGLVKSIGSPAGNETLNIALPTGATNNTFRYNGTAWAADTRLISRGSGAVSGNGGVEVTGDGSDTAGSSLYVTNATTDPTKYAIKAIGSVGASGISSVSNEAIAGYFETTTGNAVGLQVKSTGAGSAAALLVHKYAASGTGTFAHFYNFTAGTNLDFPSNGSIRFWGVGGGAGSLEIKPPASITSHTWTLPAAQGASNTFLRNDGSGILTWASSTATPGGSNTQLQYNNAGAFGGITNVTSDGSNITLLTTVGTANINASGTAATNIGTGTSAGTVTIGRTGGTITSIGTLGHTGVANINTSGTTATNIGASAGTTNSLGTFNHTGAFNLKGSSSGTLTIAVPAAITSHTLTLPAAQGAVNSFLRNDGSGGLTWVSGTTTNAAGSDTHVQFNDGGTAFGGSANFTFNKTTPQLTVAAVIAFNTSGGKTMTFGSNGTNLGGKLTIPSTGGSSITIQTCPTASTGQGFAVVTADGSGNNNGGTISLLTGAEAGTGYGGSVVINTGGTNNSGAISITTGSVDDLAGNITIQAGNTVSGVAGTVNVYAGASTSTTGDGGDINITAGNSGTSTGAGGNVQITAGSSTNGSSSGGITLLAALSGNSSTDGGNVQIYGGDALGSRTGGSVIIAPGGNGSGGTYGKIKIGTNTGHILSFFNATGAAKPAAYTQTYATTTRTLTKANAANDIGNLTISAAYSQAEVQALRNQCENLASDVRILTNFVNQILDDFQAFGML